VEYLVIDDGSSDRTVEVARELGVHHILVNGTNLGLARTFARGVNYALGAGADIIVNTDGDNQYHGPDIPKLVAPIVERTADIVVGDRETSKVEHFSQGKRLLQSFGSSVVRGFSGVQIPDAVSGFRAFSRNAAMRLNIVSSFSYTIEMLIQAGHKGMCVESVPIRTNPKTRESRLFKSIPSFIRKSGMTTLLMYAMYQPLRSFSAIGALIAMIGAIPIFRFLYFYFFFDGTGKIQSLVIGSALLTAGTITFVVGLLADLVGRNRQLLELTLERVKKLELDLRASAGGALKDEAIGEEFEAQCEHQGYDDSNPVIDPEKIGKSKKQAVLK
jgi:glycosyltransferase involved in cell wall biosynthesis